jgi:hypothetical protein
MFVLDEADRMLDMGFIHDVKKIIAEFLQTSNHFLFGYYASRNFGFGQYNFNKPGSRRSNAGFIYCQHGASRNLFC